MVVLNGISTSLSTAQHSNIVHSGFGLCGYRQWSHPSSQLSSSSSDTRLSHSRREALDESCMLPVYSTFSTGAQCYRHSEYSL